MSSVFVMTKANYDAAVEWLDESLEGMKATREEILTAELLMEENFLRFAAASGREEDFSARLTLRKRLGDVVLTLSANGEDYNPIVGMDETADDEEVMYTLALLKAHRNKMRYHRRQGENILSILVHASGSKSAVYTMIGLVAGGVLGFLMKAALPAGMLLGLVDKVFTPVETIFMHALMMLVAPMVFFSVLSGITGMSDAAGIGRIGGKLLLLSMVKMAVGLLAAAGLGIYMGVVPELTAMMADGNGAAPASFSLQELIVSIVPGNLVAPFATNNLLQVLFLACFFGVLLVRTGEQGFWLRDRIVFFNHVIMDAMTTILIVMPLVAAVSAAKLTISTELSVMLSYGRIILGAFAGVLLILLISAVFTVMVGRISPVSLLKKIVAFSSLPFSLRSSTACMPQTMEFCAKKLGMEEKLVLFSLPVGAQFNMGGSGAYIIMLAMILRQTFGLPLDADFLISFFFAVLLVSFTFPSVPGATIIVMATAFELAGIPSAAVTLFIGIDPLVDGIRSVGNVANNIVSAFLLARLENKVEEVVYDAD